MTLVSVLRALQAEFEEQLIEEAQLNKRIKENLSRIKYEK